MWPKLLGAAVGCFGLGYLIFTFTDCLRMGAFTNSPFPIGFARWSCVGLSAVLFLLSLPVYRAHDWARVVLLWLSIFAWVFLFAFSVVMVARKHIALIDVKTSVLTCEQIAEFERGETIFRLMNAGSALALLAPLALFIGVLHHPDVRKAFIRSGVAPCVTQP